MTVPVVQAVRGRLIGIPKIARGGWEFDGPLPVLRLVPELRQQRHADCSVLFVFADLIARRCIPSSWFPRDGG